MRQRLPNRRPSVTVTSTWPAHSGTPLHIAVGFDKNGAPSEIFGRAKRPESDLDNVVDDSAVLISLLLQHGATLKDISHSLGKARDGNPTSVIGAIVDIAREVEAELQQGDAP